MRSWLLPIAFGAVLAVITHMGVVHFAPPLIMDRAYTMLGQRGTPVHGFQLAPQMRPDTQSVVRPSPDLAYSGCRFDFAKAPKGLRVTMAAFDGYSSLSFYDARTINFKTIRGDGEQREVILLPPSASDQGNAAPSEKGVILIRRLAATPEAYAQIVSVAEGDTCQPL